MAAEGHRSPKVRPFNPTLAEISDAISMLADGRLDNEAIRTLGEVEDDATRETFRELIGIELGAYVPTVTGVSNVTMASGNTSRYIRIESFVVVFLSINVQATAAGAFSVGISLPIASDFASTTVAQGDAANQDGGAGRIQSDATNDRATLLGSAPNTNNRVWGGSFLYEIV